MTEQPTPTYKDYISKMWAMRRNLADIVSLSNRIPMLSKKSRTLFTEFRKSVLDDVITVQNQADLVKPTAEEKALKRADSDKQHILRETHAKAVNRAMWSCHLCCDRGVNAKGKFCRCGAGEHARQAEIAEVRQRMNIQTGTL